MFNSIRSHPKPRKRAGNYAHPVHITMKMVPTVSFVDVVCNTFIPFVGDNHIVVLSQKVSPVVRNKNAIRHLSWASGFFLKCANLAICTFKHPCSRVRLYRIHNTNTICYNHIGYKCIERSPHVTQLSLSIILIHTLGKALDVDFVGSFIEFHCVFHLFIYIGFIMILYAFIISSLT